MKIIYNKISVVLKNAVKVIFKKTNYVLNAIKTAKIVIKIINVYNVKNLLNFRMIIANWDAIKVTILKIKSVYNVDLNVKVVRK